MSNGSSMSSAAALPQILLDDLAAKRQKNLRVALVLVLLGIVSLFVDTGFGGFFDPAEVMSCYGLALSQLSASLSGGTPLPGAEVVALHPSYYRIVNQAGITVMTGICGAILALAGTLYQSTFRNPIASPSVLGVSSAIQLGDVLLVMVYGTGAASLLGMRYVFCYVCVIVTIAVLFLLSWLIDGKGRGNGFNVINLLLIATVITQLIGVVVTYVTNYVFDYTSWEVYNNISEALNLVLTGTNWAVLVVTSLVGIVPVYLMRFKLNGLNFPDADMRVQGVNAPALRLVALVCGTILLMAAQTQVGTVALLSLVVPHLSRGIFGAEFRKQFAGNLMLGAALLVGCRIIVGIIPTFGTTVPISAILNFVILPFFCWMIATQQRGWEE